MTPWVSEYIPPEDKKLFIEIRVRVEAMPDIEYERDEEGICIVLSCHILCRALANIYPEARVEDGYFRVGLCHSWLVTKHNSIIDPYVPGAIGVLILPSPRREFHDVWYSMYSKKGLIEMKEIFESWSFARAVDHAEAALRSVHIPTPVR